MKAGRDILSEYGNDISHPQAPRATKGGEESAKPTSYSPPVGPINQHHQGPGLHAHNHGNAHCPVANRGSGGPGSGGTPHRSGSQRG